MSLAVTLFLASLVYGAIVILVISIAVSATRADRLADRLLGPGSSIDLELGLLVAMDESGPVNNNAGAPLVTATRASHRGEDSDEHHQ